jgi:sialate O-acetylesterase
MIHPLVPFAIRGAIWYQGESNRHDGMIYSDKMKALIRGWRQVWGQDNFPFYFVQLAPYSYGTFSDEPQDYILPVIREAQRKTLDIPNTGMAVITDIGNIYDIQ